MIPYIDNLDVRNAADKDHDTKDKELHRLKKPDSRLPTTEQTHTYCTQYVRQSSVNLPRHLILLVQEEQ